MFGGFVGGWPGASVTVRIPSADPGGGVSPFRRAQSEASSGISLPAAADRSHQLDPA